MPETSARAVLYTEADYESLPEHVRAELVGGRFYYMAAPSRLHQKILSFLHVRIANYILSQGGACEIYPAPFAVRLFGDDDKTIVEPDISVICDPGKLTDRGCTGAPDWIIEIISPGTASHDHVRKLNLYMEAGVREYWIVDPFCQKVFVYHLEKTDFQADSYTFWDSIPVNIYADLKLSLASLGGEKRL